MIISSCIRVAANGIISLSFMAEEYPIVYTPHLLCWFICDGHLAASVPAIVNSAALTLDMAPGPATETSRESC